MPEGMKEKEMIDLLLKRFIKDYDKTKNPEVRTRYGVFAGIVGIICNLILFLAKIIAGVLTASVSIMADAVNNLSDAGSSIVTLIGFKLAGNPARVIRTDIAWSRNNNNSVDIDECGDGFVKCTENKYSF